MKNLSKLFGVILVVACAFAACELPEPTNTPKAADYEITNLAQSVGKVTAVSITPKSGKSSGARTIYYEGTGATNYAKSTALPTVSTSGTTYVVTFDVAAADGWNAVSGLYAGTLFFGTQTPVAGDYNITGLFQTYESNKGKEVTITPKDGKSGGARTIYYEGTGSTTYTKSTTAPSEEGKYTVTFDVAAVTGWNAAAGLSAGTLEINKNKTPTKNDYTINITPTQTVGSVKAVTITPKSGASSGEIKIYYEGAKYTKSTTLPNIAGKFDVTFDVAAVTGWNAATLSAGTLTINDANVPVTGIKLEGPAGNKGTVGKPITITATIQPANANKEGKDIEWGLKIKSDNDSSFNDYSSWINEDMITSPADVPTLVFTNTWYSGTYKFSAKIAIGTGSFISQELEIEVSYLKSGDYQYSEWEDEVAITGYTGSGSSVTIPENILGKPVVYIDSAVFNDKSLTSVTFAGTSKVREIGSAAFASNALTKVTIPSSVIYIYESAFFNNQLAEVNFAGTSQVQEIGEYAFADNSLKSVTIPSSVIWINYRAFSNNQELATVNFAGTSQVQSIGSSAFFNATNLASIEIPASVHYIERYAFCGEADSAFLTLASVKFNEAGIEFDSRYASFPGNLDAVYKAGGKGTYTRTQTGTTPNGGKTWSNWEKQQ